MKRLFWIVLLIVLAVIWGFVSAMFTSKESFAADHTSETGFKVTVLSAGTHETYFYRGCQINFESTVHKAFEASCVARKIAARPFQAQPKERDYALVVNDTFFYDCELVGAWTGSNAHTGAYYGNRIYHCGSKLEE